MRPLGPVNESDGNTVPSDTSLPGLKVKVDSGVRQNDGPARAVGVSS
jgi:hypothetical protein